MALTGTQRDRIRRLVGDHADPPAFSDSELDQYYLDVGEDVEKTIVECLDVLLADAAKRASYRQGSSLEDDSKLFDHLLKLREMWADRAGMGAGKIRTGAMTWTFYDEDGGPIPDDQSDLDAAGWTY